MAKYFRFPWSVTGDKIAIPDELQPSGEVSYQQGYGIDYERNPATDPNARDIERQMYNQALFDITETLQQYYQRGVPPYITAAMNGGTAYAYDQYARVRYDPGTGDRIYESLINNNTNLPTVTTAWRLADFNSLDARYPVGQLGQADGNIPQIGTPSTVGRSAVVVNSGMNANGCFRVYSDNLRTLFSTSSQVSNGSNITLPLSFITTSYIVVAIHLGTDNLNLVYSNQTKTKFQINHSFHVGIDVSWIAVGF